jgi:Aspartyl protease
VTGKERDALPKPRRLSIWRHIGVRHWIVGLALCFWGPAALADGCGLEQVAAVKMIVTDSGRVQIPVEIDGIKVQMAVDIGRGISGIWTAATASLGLTPKATIKRGVLLIDGTPVTDTVSVASLQIGNARWANIAILAIPGSGQFSQMPSEDDVVGILGQDMFANVDLELDFGAHQIRLYSQKHCPGQVVYWSRQYDALSLLQNELGNVYFSMAVNGKLMSTSMSTITAISTLEEDVAKSMLGLDRASAGVDANDGSDGCSFCQSITLEAQGLEIHNARVRVVNTRVKDCQLIVPRREGVAASYSCIGLFPLRLGVNVLSKLHLYDATREKKLYFTVANSDSGGGVSEPAPSPPNKP